MSSRHVCNGRRSTRADRIVDFYQLLDWYSRNNFKRFRSLLGKAEPRVSPAFFQRLAVSERDLQSDRT
jgi:hypothetical protein